MEGAIAHDLCAHERTDDVKLKDITPFERMNLRKNVKRGLLKNKFLYPTVIQCTAIPLVTANVDLLIQSKSGTGKTLIFTIAVLENYKPQVKLPQSLIVAPTREIAVQIEDTLNGIGEYVPGFKAVSCIGGMDVAADRKRLQIAGAVVGTPGRLLHLIQNNVFNTSAIQVFVLDESDKLYTDNFKKDMHRLKEKLPPQHQTIACSATYPNDLDKQLTKIMKDPLFISNSDRNSVLVGIRQFVYTLEPQKNSMLEMRSKLDAVRQIFERMSFKQCILFAGLKSRADSYCNYLQKDGWPCELITGAQNQSSRLETFQKFRKFESRIMVATDVMARGIDSEHVNLVINLELPNDVVTYLHRIGRAGRFGAHGIAINLLTPEQQEKFQSMVASIGTSMSVYNYPLDEASLKAVDFWKFDEYQFPYFIKAEIANELDSTTPVASESTAPTIDTQTFCINHDRNGAATEDDLKVPALNDPDCEDNIKVPDSALEDDGFKVPALNDPAADDAFKVPALNDPAMEDDSKVPALNTPILAVGESLQSSTQQLAISNTIDDASSIKSDSLNHSEHAKDFEIDEAENPEAHQPLDSSEDELSESEKAAVQRLEQELNDPDLLYYVGNNESLHSLKSTDFKFYPESEHETKLAWLKNFDLTNVANSTKEELLLNLNEAIGIYNTLFDIGQQTQFVNINLENIEAQSNQQLVKELTRLIECMRDDSESNSDLEADADIAGKLEIWENDDEDEGNIEDVQPFTPKEFKKIRQLQEKKNYTKLQRRKHRKKVAKLQKACHDMSLAETKEIQKELIPYAQRTFKRFFKKLSVKNIYAEFDECASDEEVQKVDFNPEKKEELMAWQELHWQDDKEESKKLNQNTNDWLESDDSQMGEEDDDDDIQAEVESEYKELCEAALNDELETDMNSIIKPNGETDEEEEFSENEQPQDEANNNQELITGAAEALKELSINEGAEDAIESKQIKSMEAIEQITQMLPTNVEHVAGEISQDIDVNAEATPSEITELPTTEATKSVADEGSVVSETFNETKHFTSLAQKAVVPVVEQNNRLEEEQLLLEKQKALSINIGPQLHISPARSARSPPASIADENYHADEHVSDGEIHTPNASLGSVTSGFDEHTTSRSSGIDSSSVERNSDTSYTESDDDEDGDFSQSSFINASDEDDEEAYNDYDEAEVEEETERVVRSAEFVADDYDDSTTDAENMNEAEEMASGGSSTNHNRSTTEYSEACRLWNDMYWHQRKFVEKYVRLTRQLNKQNK